MKKVMCKKNENCDCQHYKDYGACDTYKESAQENYCVYCAHHKDCHDGRYSNEDLYNTPMGAARRNRNIIKTYIIPKHDRNKPCPCGSGKKYKKCCELKLKQLRSDDINAKRNPKNEMV